MLTRCPNCATTFRLRPEQLGQAEGRVRCGKCSFAFSAIEHRIDTESADEPFPPPAPAESDSFPPLPASVSHFSTLGQRKRFVAQPDAVSDEPTESDDAGPASFNELQDQLLPSGAPDETPTEAATEAPPASLAPPEVPSAVPDGDAPAQTPVPGQAAAAEIVAIGAITDPVPQAESTGIAATESLAESADEGRTEEAQAQTGATSDYLAEPAPTRRWFWLAGMLLLGAALLIQLGYAYRTELARTYPGWRPALESACGRLGCTVELPRDAEQVSIESSELNPESDKKHLQLAATLKNRAAYPQSYPHLELTLTDVRDQPLVRRVFAPGDYLAKDAPPSFSPNTELAVKLMLEIDEVNASGYRVYLFYP